MQLLSFDNIKYAICNIYFNLILFNDINHYLATELYVKLANTKQSFLTVILSVNISHSFFNSIDAGNCVSDFVFMS